MPALKDRIRHALNESRILILGTQVLIGFQFRAVLEPRFEHFPAAVQWANVAGLGLLLVAFGLLVAPAVYHQMVERGEASASLHRFTTLAIGVALLPLSMSFGINGYVVVESRVPGHIALLTAATIVVVAVACWYVLPLAWRRTNCDEERNMTGPETVPLKDKVEHVLTEIRMVLPGAQALLGFGLAATLMESFDHLPDSSQIIHIAGVGCVMLATILLMTPASRHRLAEHGQDTEAFHGFASRMLLLAMVPLACGIAAQLLVVVRRVHGSLAVGIVAAALALLFFFGFWFGLTARMRTRRTVGSVLR